MKVSDTKLNVKRTLKCKSGRENLAPDRPNQCNMKSENFMFFSYEGITWLLHQINFFLKNDVV